MLFTQGQPSSRQLLLRGPRRLLRRRLVEEETLGLTLACSCYVIRIVRTLHAK